MNPKKNSVRADVVWEGKRSDSSDRSIFQDLSNKIFEKKLTSHEPLNEAHLLQVGTYIHIFNMYSIDVCRCYDSPDKSVPWYSTALRESARKLHRPRCQTVLANETRYQKTSSGIRIGMYL